jgi:hypothetical protein
MEQLQEIIVNPEDEVSIAPEQAANEVSIGAPVPQVNLPEEIINSRAKKISTAVGSRLMKTTDEIRQEIQEGREKALREAAATDYNAKLHQDRFTELVDLANKKGAPLDEMETMKIMDPFNPKNRETRPDSVIEKEFAQKYVSNLTDAIAAFKSNPNPVKEAVKENPAETENAFLKGSSLTFKMEFANKLVEDGYSRMNEQSVIGMGADVVKNIFQPYVEAKMRGLGDTSSVSTIGLGGHLEDTANAIFQLPDEDFAKESRRIFEGLAQDNPQLALKFAEYLKGIPASERILESAFTYLMPFDYAAIGKGIANIGRAISINRRANTAVRQLVEKADKISGDPAATAEATGDLSKAAETRSTMAIQKDLAGKPDPIQAATDDSLLTFFNQDPQKFQAEKGNLSTEQVRRIADEYTGAGKGLLQRLTDAVRINRIPMPLAVENAVRVLKNAAKDYYPAIRNSILDVSDPIFEPRSNTFWHRITFGNFDGSLFSNEKTAQNFAKLHGLNARIVEDTGSVTTKAAEELFQKRSRLQNDLLTVDDNVARNKARALDETLPEAERIKANEQAELFTKFKREAGKELEGIELGLRGEHVRGRVEALRNEADLLKAANKETRKRLLKDTLTGEEREALKGSIKANAERIRANLEESAAIKSGKADVIGGTPEKIQQHGVGFKLVIERPLTETDKVVRDLMIRDVDGKLYPEAISSASRPGLSQLMNAALGKIRGADDTLALNESIQRKIGTYTQSLFKEWASQEAAYIRQIASGVLKTDPVTGQPLPYWKAKPQAIYDKLTGTTKERYDAFTRTLDHARDAKDPDGKPGYFFQTPGELNDHYLRFFGRSPSFAEHEAYFAFVRMVEGDRVLREIAEFRNRARLGVEQFQLTARAGRDAAQSGFFDGRILKKFPGGDDVMLIMSRRLGDEKIVNLGGGAISPQKLELYRDLVKQGRLKVIEVYAPEQHPLRKFSDIAGNEHVRYVLTDAAETKPIEFNHVQRRGGGHFEYDYDHYIKQAKYYHQYENLQGVRSRFKSVYTGDTTFMPVLNRIMGRDIIGKVSEVQRLIKEGNLTAAEAYTKQHLPIEWDELHGMFKPGRDADGKTIPPQLDLNEPFHLVPNGMTVRDVDHQGMIAKYGDSWKDAERSGSLNRQFQVQYNTERESFGLKHLEDVGSEGNPLYKYSPTTKMVDPITTMNKSLNRIVNTVFMDDYKIFAVEHWLREAEPYLEPVRSALARSSPNWVFTSSNDKSAFLAGAPREVVNNLLNNRYKVYQFTGVPNRIDTAVHTAKQWLVDTTYRHYGPTDNRSILGKAVEVVPNWMLDRVRDPVTFLRSMTFHEKLGLFNPAQLLVQMQTFSTIFAISPKHGTAGTSGALLYTWSRLNRNAGMLEAMDTAATKLALPGQAKWRPGEFMEATRALEATGFDRVAGEYANLNTALKTDFIGNDFKSFLNAGTFFFKEGERSARVGAFYTAYKEFRGVRRTGALTRDDIGRILQRADLLTVNMSRASNSALNSGFLSLTTQFLTYQMRLAELFMGKRLGETLYERNMARARLLTFYSALYGAPSAIGLTGLPMADSIRKEAIQRGYKVGDNWLSTAVDQGLPAVAAAYLSGGLDFRKGNNYNIGGRFGSPGFTQFNDALKSDHAWWQLLAGASGTALLSTLTSSNNFFHAMASQMFRPNGEKPFPLKLDDFIDVFKEISSVNQTWKMITAINTGKWMSKNEGYVGDVSKANAAFMAITGLSPQQQEDAFIKNDLRKQEADYQKYVMREAIKEIRRGYQDQKDNNWESASKHFKRADTLMEVSGFPARRKADVMSMATKGYETTIDAGDYQFTFKNTPKSRSDFMGIPLPFTTQSNIPATRREQFREQQRLNTYKGQ